MSKRYVMALGAAVVVTVAGLAVGGCTDPADDLKSSDPVKCAAALRELGKRNTESAAAKITEAVNHPDEMVAAEAIRTLGGMRQAEAAAVLKEVALQEKRAAVRQEAVVQLGRRKEAGALEALRRSLENDPDPRVRAAAATSLARQRSYPDVALLVRVAETEPDLMVQNRIVGAVERMIGLKFGYNPNASPEERQKALERMRGVAIGAAAELQENETKKKNAS